MPFLGQLGRRTFLSLKANSLPRNTNSDLREVERQIRGGSNVNEFDWPFETPVIRAARTGNSGIAAHLLDAGADVDFLCLDDTSAMT